MESRRKFIFSAGIVMVALVIYSILFLTLKFDHGLRSVWPGFVFLFAVCYYLLSKPMSEESDA